MKFKVIFGKGAWGNQGFRKRPNAVAFARQKQGDGVRVFGVLKITNTSACFVKWKDGRKSRV